MIQNIGPGWNSPIRAPQGEATFNGAFEEFRSTAAGGQEIIVRE